jgi:hypothetical protein
MGRRDRGKLAPPALIRHRCMVLIPPIRMFGKPTVTKVVTRLIGRGGIKRIRLIPSKPTEMVNDQC